MVFLSYTLEICSLTYSNQNSNTLMIQLVLHIVFYDRSKICIYIVKTKTRNNLKFQDFIHKILLLLTKTSYIGFNTFFSF